MTSLDSSLRTSLPSFGGSMVAPLLFALAGNDAAPQARTWLPGGPAGNCPMQIQGSPTFLSSSHVPTPGSTTPDGFSAPSHYGVRTRSLGTPRQGLQSKAFRGSIARHQNSLSTLRRVVHTTNHARLATSCWLNSTGRDSIPTELQ